ncbi:uncharacterized protein NECHADRAFT_89357 [Fusarium vanettenii 77-13-4]|uniref:FAD-binding PCMH-type domain-containing protein n=1 Tax=Fusarium vanettenii (strain ATCC MYA-4622 / CBS 123669 / FGSC 9596 / NRRL 45880 / 77-13-4) TaxID=660122 RepID=C7ZQZ0_FUSV7|nr:uncharacterized protein NECHADRAFT_89357 [Fusarium vanettenii 77-13-4]EEU33575.1 hypothetical protein NECHADRAFT_89357 [Fusarium vanettenii 77-13-4]
MVQWYASPELQSHHDHAFGTRRPGTRTLPPGHDEGSFLRVLDEFRAAIGQENVIVDDDLVNFRDPYPLFEEGFEASAGLCPSTVEEIQAILKIANQHQVPMWTCSQGKNFGYGGPAPRVAGSMVLSLQRMKRILEVNEKLAYIVVEPGVTFFDVYNHLVENKLDLWVSVPALGWGSVTLDRGHGYTISGDRQHFIGSLEVVLASGDVLRTGQWAVPNSPSAYACPNSFGPQVDGLFLQSNLGIVTKMAVALDVAPASFMGVNVYCPEVEDIAPLIDTLQIQEVVTQNLPNAWTEHKLYEGKDGRPVDNSEIGTLPAGVPSMLAVKLADYNLPADGTGAGAHIDTTLILPCEGNTVLTWFRKAKAIMEEQGVDPFIGCHVFSKYILFVQEYVFDKTSTKAREGGRKVVKALLTEAEKNGRFVETLKAAVDPNGILSPGKQGIWPLRNLVYLPLRRG